MGDSTAHRTSPPFDQPPSAGLLAAIERLHDVVHGRDVPPLPEEFAAVPRLAELYHDLVELRAVLGAMARGDLATAVSRRNYVSATLKTLQANLFHLTWQAQMVAAGDFTQRVDFLGDFSDAFNTMVGQLDASIQTLKCRERELEAALEQKRLLLQEVNHRVKNNLFVVASLLGLQSSLVKDPLDADLFREAESRVKVMATIHEMLYRSITLDTVPAGEFFTGIAGQIIRSWSHGNVGLQVECGDLVLGLNTVIPCGLMINELVTNALKYAFPQGQAGRIAIDFLRDRDGFLVLTVRDDGVGLPEGFDVERTESLGLILVNSLARQLNGSLAVQEGSGACFVVRFPSEEAELNNSGRDRVSVPHGADRKGE